MNESFVFEDKTSDMKPCKTTIYHLGDDDKWKQREAEWAQAAKLPGNMSGHNCDSHDHTRIINGSFYYDPLMTCRRLRKHSQSWACLQSFYHKAMTGSKHGWNKR